LGQEGTEEQLVASVRSQLESRAGGSQTLQYFDAAMNSKKHKQGECDEEQVAELTKCLQVSAPAEADRNNSNFVSQHHYHLSDAITGDMNATQVFDGLEDFDCGVLSNDMKCFRRSECFQTQFGGFNFNVTVDGVGELSAKQVCSNATNASVVEACEMTPQKFCQTMVANEVMYNNTDEELCNVSSCEPMNEVEGLEVAYCQKNATTATDLFINTKKGCKAAVEAFKKKWEANLTAASEKAGEGKTTIKFHKKLARWMRTAKKPYGCYLYFKGRKGKKIRGYFNPHSKLSAADTRNGTKVGTAKKERAPQNPAVLRAALEIVKRKKQEAIERSKARQKDPNYFQKISESNVKPEPKVLDGLEEIQSSTESEDAGEGGSGQGASDDPFSNKTKSRGKIHFNF